MTVKIKSHLKQKSKSRKLSRSKSQKRSKQRGGSPASSMVMEATMRPPAMHDYVSSPRVRDEWSDDFKSLRCQQGGKGGKGGRKSKSKSKAHFGGSVASDYVMSNLTTDAKTFTFPPALSVNADINSLNTYKPSGGARRSNKSNKRRPKKQNKNKSKKSKMRKHKTMRGGHYGSDWMSSQYSLGSYNAAEQSADYVKQFSSSGAGSRADYMNPPNLGSAGSGGAVGDLEGSSGRVIGAPLI